MYHGDFALGKTFDIKFTTRRFSTGAPYTLAGTPSVAAYPDNSTTEVTAGITLTVDFDSRTGLNNVRVVATSGNGYATATNYTLVITAGTVDSVSVVGECVGSFSIEARSALRPATADRTLVVDAAGLADANAVKVGPSGSGTAQTAGDIIGDTNDIQSRLPAALGANGNIKADVRDYNGTAGTFSGGRPEVKLGDVAHAGTAATLTLERIIVASTTTNEPGVKITGNGSGAGLQSTGGSTGHGALVSGGGGGGDGAHLHASFGSGLSAEAHGSNGAGANFVGDGTGSGLKVVGGSEGHGLLAMGGTTSGDGINATAQGTGDEIDANITGNLSGSVGSVTSGVTLADDAITASKFDESTAFPLKSADSGSTLVARTGADSDTLETLSDQIDGTSTLNAAGIRTAVGLASANLDTQLGDIPTNSELATALITGLTTALTEGYRSTGAIGSVRDLLYEIIAHLGESSMSGTTKTLKKLDGSTTAKTYTLNDATTPTSITETT